MGRKRKNEPISYQELTHASPHWIVRWPHQRRFELAIDEIVRDAPATMLDYGTGDAYLLERLAERGKLPQTVAYEPVEEFAVQARETVARCGLQDRVRVVSDIAECYGESFDLIACLSVMEHMPFKQRALFYDLCEKTLAPDGRVVVEVPVEIGPSVLVKELGRTKLKSRVPEYTTKELLRRAFGRGGRDELRYDEDNLDTWIQHHTNFDYRCFRDEVGERFEIVKTFPSPMPHVPAPLGNQEYFLIFGRR